MVLNLRQMTKRQQQQSDWQTIFAASKVNGADYFEPARVLIQWPKSTWLQRRLKERRRNAQVRTQR
jgi:hypothetical protein